MSENFTLEEASKLFKCSKSSIKRSKFIEDSQLQLQQNVEGFKSPRKIKEKESMESIVKMLMPTESGREYSNLSTTRQELYKKYQASLQVGEDKLSITTFYRYLRTLRIHNSTLPTCPHCIELLELERLDKLTTKQQETLEKKKIT